MTKKEDIYKDQFIKNLMKDVDMEEPSDQFTNTVMDNVMQEWLAKPIEVKKPISRKQWFISAGLIFILVVILLGTDVRTLISDLDHPFFNQINAILLNPLNQILNQLLDSLIKLPVMVYIVAVAMGTLVLFDQIINKLLQYR
jgi:hypothetical protein